jgi:hypothetical protein
MGQASDKCHPQSGESLYSHDGTEKDDIPDQAEFLFFQNPTLESNHFSNQLSRVLILSRICSERSLIATCEISHCQSFQLHAKNAIDSTETD